jgi:hypothetical protein
MDECEILPATPIDETAYCKVDTAPDPHTASVVRKSALGSEVVVPSNHS